MTQTRQSTPSAPQAASSATSKAAGTSSMKIAPSVPLIVRKRCLHARHVSSECTRCIDVCGSDALKIVGQQLVIESRRCSSCGACAAVCPTEALYVATPESHDLMSDIKAHAAEGTLSIACRMAKSEAKDTHTAGHGRVLVPCLARLTPQMLMEAVDAGAKTITLNCGACGTCAKRPKTEIIRETLEAVQQWLAVRGASKKGLNDVTVSLEASDKSVNSARRAAFGRLFGLSTAALDREPFQLPRDFKERLDVIRREPLVRLPETQKARFMRFQRATEAERTAFPLDAPVVNAELCECCGQCAQMCPSGALKVLSEKPYRMIASPLLCCGCRLCADICYKKAVTMTHVTTMQEAGARTVIEKTMTHDPMATWEDKLEQFLGDVPIYRS